MSNRPEQVMSKRAEDNGRHRGLRLRGLAQVGIGVGALALLIIKSDARGLVEAIKATRVAWLPLAVLASVAVTWLMAYRWGLILAVRGHRMKTSRLFVYYLIGIFFMNFVPGGGVSGDVARLLYVDRDVRDKAFVLSTLVYERMVGLFVLLLIGLAATLASRAYLPPGRMLYAGEAFLAIAFFASAMLMSEAVSSRLARLALRLGGRFRAERIGQAAARVLGAISELRQHRRMLLTTVLLSFIIRVVWGMGAYVVARAMGLPLNLLVVFAFISLVDLIRMLPISVGGLGVREWAMVALFANVGIGREQALMFSFLVFAPVLLNAVAGGIIYISRAGVIRADRAVGETRSVEA
ncbi:MAG TPA: lysylphosphatidylglycerol synthase transmembrane domain-containing protein [Blastocatellia bacterium]|nr:lysylphosphatidylglycerol synthase transmembrane domain-containing protein [Blastocatellia bacterium]